MRLGAEELGHERDYEGLRDRLIEADLQRRVLVSEGGQEEGQSSIGIVCMTLSAGGRWIRTFSSWLQEGASLSVMGPFRGKSCPTLK
jgi:hypothetical protein